MKLLVSGRGTGVSSTQLPAASVRPRELHLLGVGDELVLARLGMPAAKVRLIIAVVVGDVSCWSVSSVGRRWREVRRRDELRLVGRRAVRVDQHQRVVADVRRRRRVDGREEDLARASPADSDGRVDRIDARRSVSDWSDEKLGDGGGVGTVDRGDRGDLRRRLVDPEGVLERREVRAGEAGRPGRPPRSGPAGSPRGVPAGRSTNLPEASVVVEDVAGCRRSRGRRRPRRGRTCRRAGR